MDRSPPVVSKGGEEKRKFEEAPGSPSVAGASAAAGSQKATSAPLATLDMGRVGAKARHSARQAEVRTSPFQQAGMRAPAEVHPGHRLYVACSRRGHSKLRWRRPGKATLTAQVQPEPVGSAEVQFGSAVTILREGGRRQSFRIVGEDEADVKLGKISITSPIARAMIGKEEGDVVEVAAPGGSKSYEIVAVTWA